MRAYIIRRVLLIIPVLLLVCLIVFSMIRLIPGDVVELMLSDMGYEFQQSDIAQMREALGINVSIYTQFIRWISGVAVGNLGLSIWTGRPIIDDLIVRLPVSAELGLLSILISLIIALPVGVFSAIRQDTPNDFVGRSFAVFCMAVPGFWLATLIMVYPSIWWRWTPPLEYIPFAKNPIGNLGQFLLPAIILGMSMSGTTMRMMRTMMLEVLRQDYVRTAWAKGLRERTVIQRHALKNALIPVVTVIGLHVPVLVGSAVVIEHIFCLPGIGGYLLDSLNHRDYIATAAVNLFVAGAVLAMNLIVDISYAYLDPRIHYQ